MAKKVLLIGDIRIDDTVAQEDIVLPIYDLMSNLVKKKGTTEFHLTWIIKKLFNTALLS